MLHDKLIGKIARAFWRRIEPFKNDYGKELPIPLPVEFQAHMATALSLIDLEIPKVNGVSIDVYSPNKTGVLIMFERQLTNDELTRLHYLLSGNT